MSEPTNLWNAAYEASPAGTDLISNGDDEIRNFKKDIRQRHEREHVRNASDKELDGLHREGSARAYYDASEPTNRPDGTSLDTNDDGRLWYDSAEDTLYIWTGTEWEELDYVRTSGNQTIAGEKTFEDDVIFGDSFRIWADGGDTKIGRGSSVAITVDDDERVTLDKGRVPADVLQGTHSASDLFDDLAPSIPNVADRIIVVGGIYYSGTLNVVSRAYRLDSDTVRLYGIREDGEPVYMDFDEGGPSSFTMSLAW